MSGSNSAQISCTFFRIFVVARNTFSWTVTNFSLMFSSSNFALSVMQLCKGPELNYFSGHGRVADILPFPALLLLLILFYFLITISLVISVFFLFCFVYELLRRIRFYFLVNLSTCQENMIRKCIRTLYQMKRYSVEIKFITLIVYVTSLLSTPLSYDSPNMHSYEYSHHF